MDKKILPENGTLLHRDAANGGIKEQPREISRFRPPILDRVEYENRARIFQMLRESFLVDSINRGTFASNRGGGRGSAVCEECMRAKGTGIDGGFHPCVNDEVIVGFRLSAGPVCRPAKNSGEEHP